MTKNKIQLTIMNVIKSYYTSSSKNTGVELMFLFNIGLPCLINKLSLNPNKSCWSPEPKW